MTIAPLLNVPITLEDALIEVVRRPQADSDQVFVTTNISLADDLDPKQEVKLLLPMSQQQIQKPLLRWTEDDITGPVTAMDDVDRPTGDKAVGEALQAILGGDQEREQALAAAIKQAAAEGGYSSAVLTVPPGQRQLRFFMSFAAPKASDGTYSFTLLAPLSSFTLQTGGTVGVVTLLARGASLVSATATNSSSSEIAVAQQSMGGRLVLGWAWQNDPTFTVKYHY
ncbi:MAG: hypothetical protein ACJ74O_06175 [Frankiaceae bacterium]